MKCLREVGIVVASIWVAILLCFCMSALAADDDPIAVIADGETGEVYVPLALEERIRRAIEATGSDVIQELEQAVGELEAAIELRLTEDDGDARYQPKGDYQEAGDYATISDLSNSVAAVKSDSESYTDAAAAAAVSESKSYTDTQLLNVAGSLSDYIDGAVANKVTTGQLAEAVADANAYTDAATSNAHAYAESVASAAEESANEYADTRASEAQTNAQAYTDAATSNLATKADVALSAVAAVSGRVDVVEGWGNHAEAGYLTAESDTAALAAVAGVESNLTAHAADTENPHGVTAGQIGALTAEEAEVLLAAATNIVVESVGGPLFEDFATAEFRVSGSGWGVTATGAAVNHGNVIARENTLGLRENFTIAFTNIRSSVEGGVPTATAGDNLSDGPFSSGSWDMAGNMATGLHWSAGVQSGAVGVVECTLGTWTVQISRTFPGYTATTNVYEFLGFVPGSLRATVDADMLARNATGDINPFETTTTWPNLVRNTNVWTKDMDLTCVSPYNSLGSWTYSFTLVTPQHVVFASHWPRTTTNSSLIDGHALYFVDSTNGLHSREVVKARQVWLDCSVGLLDAPLPPSVTPAKIIDTNDFAKFKGVETLRPRGSFVGPSGMIGVHVRPTYARAVRVRFDPPTPDHNTYWWSSRDPNLRHSDTHSGTNYVGGESGNPVLLCIEGQTAIAQTLYSGGGAGPHIAALRPQIEATMATLGASAYTNLETINLAHWPDYP